MRLAFRECAGTTQLRCADLCAVRRYCAMFFSARSTAVSEPCLPADTETSHELCNSCLPASDSPPICLHMLLGLSNFERKYFRFDSICAHESIFRFCSELRDVLTIVNITDRQCIEWSLGCECEHKILDWANHFNDMIKMSRMSLENVKKYWANGSPTKLIRRFLSGIYGCAKIPNQMYDVYLARV